MKKIAFVFIAALAVLSFTGCKKKGGGVGEAMAKMEGFKTAMCACKDKACAEKVSKDMAAYGESMKGKEQDPKSISEADKKKMTDIVMEMSKCQQAAMGAEGAAPTEGAAPAAGGTEGAAPAAGGETKPEEKKEEKK